MSQNNKKHTAINILSRCTIRTKTTIDKTYIKLLTAIAVPVVLQNLLGAMLNLVDNVMVGGLGEESMAAVGIANQIFFIFSLVLFGLTSGLSVYIAQFWGCKMLSDIRKTIALGLILCLSFSLIFTVVSMTIPKSMIAIFTNDPAVIELGAQFLRIVAIGFPLTAISMVYSVALRSTEKPVFPLVSSVISLGICTLLNYLLIYGKFGFPRLGVPGSAIATVIARIAEITMILFMVYRWKMIVACYITDFKLITKRFVISIFRLAAPITLNESLWVLGVSVFSAVYGRMGTSDLAAYNIVATLERLSFVAILGLGSACAVLVGKQIGEKNFDRAYAYAKNSIILAPIIGILIGITLMIIRQPIISVYDVQEIVKQNAASLILISAITIPFRSFNFTNLMGALRAGGDTNYALFLDTVPLWAIAVPLSIFTGLYLGWPLPYVYAIIFIEEIIKAVFGFFRFLSKKWMNDLTEAHIRNTCEEK